MSMSESGINRIKRLTRNILANGSITLDDLSKRVVFDDRIKDDVKQANSVIMDLIKEGDEFLLDEDTMLVSHERTHAMAFKVVRDASGHSARAANSLRILSSWFAHREERLSYLWKDANEESIPEYVKEAKKESNDVAKAHKMSISFGKLLSLDMMMNHDKVQESLGDLSKIQEAVENISQAAAQRKEALLAEMSKLHQAGYQFVQDGFVGHISESREIHDSLNVLSEELSRVAFAITELKKVLEKPELVDKSRQALRNSLSDKRVDMDSAKSREKEALGRGEDLPGPSL